MREILACRIAAEGAACGRLKDIYFDDLSWAVRYFVAAVGVQRNGDNLKVIEPGGVEMDGEAGLLRLPMKEEAVEFLPAASGVKPVCKQYESLAQGSPGSRVSIGKTDPHLRSWAIVSGYPLEYAGEAVGRIDDMLVDERSWTIRYLKVRQCIEGKALEFYISPSAVERISWAAQRVCLRELQPVRLKMEPDSLPKAKAA